MSQHSTILAMSTLSIAAAEPLVWSRTKGLEEVKALETFHSTVRIYKDLFSRPGARTVNWTPLMDVKYQQIRKHCQSMRSLKASLNATPERTDEDTEIYEKASELYLSALDGYTALCEILQPRTSGTGLATGIGGVDQQGRRDASDDNRSVDDVPRNLWRSDVA